MKKRTMLRLLFSAELFVFAWFYYYGSHGLHTVYDLREENVTLEHEIVAMKDALTAQEAEVVCWQTDPFYKEKLAREQLHMAKEGEQVYLYERT